ncbi:MAG: cyclic nucleotide-binding domain-containing protein [Elusimicrobiales bacterium]
MKSIIEKILSDEELSKLIELKKIQEGEIIFNEGDDSHSIFFILDGTVTVEKSINESYSEFKELAYIQAPSFIGEIALFEDLKRTARARAKTQCKVAELSKENFNKILEKNPTRAIEILFNISKTLALRLAHTSKELTLLYDISKYLSESYTDEKEFLKNIFNEIKMYFSECEVEVYYYNIFNEEFEKIFELDRSKDFEPDIKTTNSSRWLDRQRYIAIIKDDKNTQAAAVFIFHREISQHQINDYTTIFNTISYIVSAGLKGTARNKEMILIERLKRKKGEL